MSRDIHHDDFRPWNQRLRPASDKDAPALRDLIFATLAEFGMQPEHDGIDRDLDALEDTYADGGFWVTETPNGDIAASAGMLPVAPGIYELRRMYMHAHHRGHGLGRALLGLALHWARQRRAHSVVLETASVLEAARHLYEWAGFRPDDAPLETQRCDQRMVLTLNSSG